MSLLRENLTFWFTYYSCENFFFPVWIEEAQKGDAANKVGAGEDVEVSSSYIFVSILDLMKFPYSF